MEARLNRIDAGSRLRARRESYPLPPNLLRINYREEDDASLSRLSRRPAGAVRVKGEGAVIAEGGTKSGKARSSTLTAARWPYSGPTGTAPAPNH